MKSMHNTLIEKGWQYYDDKGSIASFPLSEGFYQKRIFTYGNNSENIYADLVVYGEIPHLEKGRTYELCIYLPDDFNVANNPIQLRVYSFPEEELDPDKCEELAKEIIKRLRKP